MFYPERKDNSKAAFALGLGVGAALAVAGAYALKKFKEHNPNFSIKGYCEKCGLAFDECDWGCEEDCDGCYCSEPEYEDVAGIEDIELDMESVKESDDEEESSDADEESDGTNLIGKREISFETAKAKAEKIAEEMFGKSISLKYEADEDYIVITNEGKKIKCYMFWIAGDTDDLVPKSVFYVDIVTGEVFDNSNKEMKKISD